MVSHILKKDNIVFAIFAMLSLFAIILISQSANAISSSDNMVAQTANTNKDNIKSCKEAAPSTKDCATGPISNGEQTSDAAHIFNGP